MVSVHSMAEKRRLDYACRRGTRELEQVVRAFLENYYDDAGDEQQHIFRWLLSMEDDQLWDWIFLRGQQHCTDKKQSSAVKSAIEQYINQRVRKHI